MRERRDLGVCCSLSFSLYSSGDSVLVPAKDGVLESFRARIYIYIGALVKRSVVHPREGRDMLQPLGVVVRSRGAPLVFCQREGERPLCVRSTKRNSEIYWGGWVAPPDYAARSVGSTRGARGRGVSST